MSKTLILRMWFRISIYEHNKSLQRTAKAAAEFERYATFLMCCDTPFRQLNELNE